MTRLPTKAADKYHLLPGVFAGFLLVYGCLVAGTVLAGSYKGQSVREVLDGFLEDGIPLVYSTNLVPSSLRILDEPAESSDAISVISSILEPHDLALKRVDGMYLVVRRHAAPEAMAGGTVTVIVRNADAIPSNDMIVVDTVPGLPSPAGRGRGIYEYTGLDPGYYEFRIGAAGYATTEKTVELAENEAAVVIVVLQKSITELETISVSASRYVLFSNSQFFIDQRAIQALPDLGEDPLRSVQRLPGTAASGLSAKSHFRGGEHNETAIYLNGLQLLDPFHIRDYHSIFSSIDARAISGVEAFTGGFPAPFGDHMSGVLLLDTQKPDKPLHTELGLSVFNTSILNTGHTSNDKIDWLVSARRSNLGMVLKRDWGKPEYFDVFTQLGFNLSPDTRLSINGLVADDKVTVTLESVPEELEESVSDTANQHFWLLLENQWSAFLSSNTVLSWSSFSNKREAQVNDEEKYVAFVTDHREADIIGLRQDWRYDGIQNHVLNWGFKLQRLKARYFYASAAEYFEFFERYPGIESPTRSLVQAAPEGNAYALFFTDRWRLSETTSLQWGLRWDRQTYTKPVYDDQLSPRISLLRTMGETVELRLTWGRFFQSQSIQQLQTEDGLDHFFEPQLAEHWIAGLQARLGPGYRLRAEVFYKDYSRLKPRFENLHDPLALIPELAPDRVRLDPTSANARGIELTAEYNASDELNWWAGYTWSKASDIIAGQRQPRSWDQRHAIQAGLAWRRQPWEIGVAISVHQGWPITGMILGYDEEEDEYLPVPGPRNAERLNTFASLDFRISREIPVRRGRLTGFFEVTNATNRKNQCCYDFDIDEDENGEVFLDAVADQWLPAIPAIGLLWEF